MLFGDKPGKDPERPTELMKFIVEHYFKRITTR
jgi:para-nitrobenzyl esterase